MFYSVCCQLGFEELNRKNAGAPLKPRNLYAVSVTLSDTKLVVVRKEDSPGFGHSETLQVRVREP